MEDFSLVAVAILVAIASAIVATDGEFTDPTDAVVIIDIFIALLFFFIVLLGSAFSLPVKTNVDEKK